MKNWLIRLILTLGLPAAMLRADPDANLQEDFPPDDPSYNEIFANANSVLKQNVIDMEYNVNQARDLSGGLTGFNGYQVNKDNLNVLYKLALSSDLDVSHEVALGMQSPDNWSGHADLADKESSLNDSLRQSQKSNITYRAGDALKFSVFNNISSDVQNSAANMSSQLEFGARAEWKLLPETTLMPQLSKSTNWAATNDVRQRQRVAFSLRQDIYKNAVSLTVTPSMYQENESWSSYSQTQRAEAVDASLRVQVSKSAVISVGNNFEMVNKEIDYSEVASQRYYVEWRQQASEDVSLRVRSEYTVNDTYLDPVLSNDYQENTVRFIFGPQVSISDSLTANAEFQYVVEQALSEVTRQESCEKMVSFSLKHDF